MTRLQTRYLATSVGLLAALIVSFGVIMVFVSDLINNAYPDFVVATAILLFCSTSSALIWELCRRRIWVAIFIVAALPSLCGMVFVLVTLGVRDLDYTIQELGAMILFLLYGVVFGQFGQAVCIPAAATYWVVSHLILRRFNAHPRRLLKAKELDTTFE